jgi:hypothetical protein
MPTFSEFRAAEAGRASKGYAGICQATGVLDERCFRHNNECFLPARRRKMPDLNHIFLFLAVPCALIGVILMVAMISAVQDRGHKVHWIFLGLFALKYVNEYRTMTSKETGRPGPLYYPFVISMNLALLFVIVGLLLQ